MSFKDVCSIYALNILNTYCNANKKKFVLQDHLLEKIKNKISSSDEMKFFNEYLNNFNTEDMTHMN